MVNRNKEKVRLVVRAVNRRKEEGKWDRDEKKKDECDIQIEDGAIDRDRLIICVSYRYTVTHLSK